MKQVVRKFSVGDGNKGYIIEFKQIVYVLEHFRYVCTQHDQDELRFWILNHDLIAKTPEFYRKEVVFIDARKFVKALVDQYSTLGLTVRKTDKNEKSLGLVYQDIKDHVLGNKLDQMVEVLQIFKRHNAEGLIGERELRRVLFEYLEHATDAHITTLIY